MKVGGALRKIEFLWRALKFKRGNGPHFSGTYVNITTQTLPYNLLHNYCIIIRLTDS